jgi:hypothetical protein
VLIVAGLLLTSLGAKDESPDETGSRRGDAVMSLEEAAADDAAATASGGKAAGLYHRQFQQRNRLPSSSRRPFAAADNILLHEERERERERGERDAAGALGQLQAPLLPSASFSSSSAQQQPPIGSMRRQQQEQQQQQWPSISGDL